MTPYGAQYVLNSCMAYLAEQVVGNRLSCRLGDDITVAFSRSGTCVAMRAWSRDGEIISPDMLGVASTMTRDKTRSFWLVKPEMLAAIEWEFEGGWKIRAVRRNVALWVIWLPERRLPGLPRAFYRTAWIDDNDSGYIAPKNEAFAFGQALDFLAEAAGDKERFLATVFDHLPEALRQEALAFATPAPDEVTEYGVLGIMKRLFGFVA